ncbi:MAG: Holliday junction branch migration protein RuvA [Spirochaetia bacterium]|nr:Holliday junction branch migration protein RuvA [Spirochaetia bacterium]
MISGIQGTVARLGASSVFILAGGLEYEVLVPLNVFDLIERQKAGTEVRLYIHHHFSQEDQRLYGFIQPEQREVFRALIQLQGMGPSLVLSVMSHYDGATLLQLCESGNVDALKQIPRVGDKTARRMVFEITGKKDRFKKLLSGNQKATARESDQDLAREALVQLGYREQQIMEAFKKLDPKPTTASDWISQTLRNL